MNLNISPSSLKLPLLPSQNQAGLPKSPASFAASKTALSSPQDSVQFSASIIKRRLKERFLPSVKQQKKVNQDLIDAVKNNDVDVAREAILSGAQVQGYTNDEGELVLIGRLLETAVSNDNEAMVDLLMLHDVVTPDYSSMAYDAISNDNPSILRKLIAYNPKVVAAMDSFHYLSSADPEGEVVSIRILPHLKAIIDKKLDCLKVLLEEPFLANLRAYNEKVHKHYFDQTLSQSIEMAYLSGNVDDLANQVSTVDGDIRSSYPTPLILAVASGFTDAIGPLLQAGASPLLRDLNFRTALDCALELNNYDAAKQLLDAEPALIALTDSQKRTWLDGALEDENYTQLDFLLKTVGAEALKANRYDRDDVTVNPLLNAIENENIDLLRTLIENADNGVDIDIQDNNGRTPLMHAVQNNWVDVIDLLLENGADPERADKQGRSAIVLAASQRKFDIAARLTDALENR